MTKLFSYCKEDATTKQNWLSLKVKKNACRATVDWEKMTYFKNKVAPFLDPIPPGTNKKFRETFKNLYIIEA